MKTKRGLEGRIRQGKSAGGISYGYKVVRDARPDGTMSAGDRVIDPDEASVVGRIFLAYAHGTSPRSIARSLNMEEIPGPSGRAWGASTIYGNWRRGTGLLNNELYIGRMVWNRQHFVKDPATGKRQARLNSAEYLIVEDVPHLRIIDDDLWYAVKQRQQIARLEADLKVVE